VDWRRLHNGELYNLYSFHITRVIKSRRMRWAWQVNLWGRGEIHTGFLFSKSNRKRLLGIPMPKW
jgi:hypothetical protein